jgi:hypothetical protein
MKLTKGKISKLYNKKNQSLKRKNSKKSASFKTKTFRNKRNINLANKSLKRIYKGGASPKEMRDLESQLKNIEEKNAKLDDKMEAKNEEIQEPVSTEPVTPLIQNNNDEPGNVEAENVIPMPESLPSTSESLPSTSESLTPIKNESENFTLTPESVPSTTESVTPIPESLPTTSENVTPIPESAPSTSENVEPVPIIESTPTPSEVSTATSSATASEIPSINNDINAQVNQLIATVAEKTAKQIADDVALKIPSTNEGQQNGFNAVQEATEKMTTGGKYKTKRFRLTNRKKTRKHQA